MTIESESQVKPCDMCILELESANKQIASLTERVKEMEASIAAVQRAYTDVSHEYLSRTNDLQSQLDAANKRNGELEMECNALTEESRRLGKQLEQGDIFRINNLANVQRIREWFYSSNRKPANTAFTDGPDRQIAYMLEDNELANEISGNPFVSVIREVVRERQRQDHLWGEQNHSPEKYLLILNEEVGEANKAICDHIDFSNDSIFEKGLKEYRNELIQVAAVAIAMVECLDRDKWRNPR